MKDASAQSADPVKTLGQNEPTDMLKEEYFFLQRSVEKYDAHLINVKKWSVTVSMAAIGTAMVEAKGAVLLLAAGSALLFWIIDALWKSFQNANYYRLRLIERYLGGEVFKDFKSPMITGAWGRGRKKGPSTVKIMLWPQVYLPHAPVVVVAIVLWMLGVAN